VNVTTSPTAIDRMVMRTRVRMIATSHLRLHTSIDLLLVLSSIVFVEVLESLLFFLRNAKGESERLELLVSLLWCVAVSAGIVPVYLWLDMPRGLWRVQGIV